MPYNLSAILCSLLLTGCQLVEEAGNNQAFHIPIGAIVELHQPVVIPADQAGAFIQGTAIGDRHRYDAACRLEVRTLAPAPRPVQADRFLIKRINRTWEIFSIRRSERRYVRLTQDFAEGPSLFILTTDLYLHSEHQPDVFRLVCSHLQDSAHNPRHLTIHEIRTVLAPLITLH